MEKEDYRKEEPFEQMIVKAFYLLLSEDRYRLSYVVAQELYNKICDILLLVPTAITYVK